MCRTSELDKLQNLLIGASTTPRIIYPVPDQLTCPTNRLSALFQCLTKQCQLIDFWLFQKVFQSEESSPPCRKTQHNSPTFKSNYANSCLSLLKLVTGLLGLRGIMYSLYLIPMVLMQALI